MCDRKLQQFSLVSVVDTDNQGVVPIRNGYRRMTRSDKILKCRIGKFGLVAKIKLLSARERGQCSAFDSYLVVSLKVDGKLVYAQELFSNVCEMSDPSLYAIEILTNRGVLVQKECRGKWDWTEGYKKGTCNDQ